MTKLEQLLGFLEDSIDLNRQKEVEELHINVLDYKKVPYLPLIIKYPLDKSITTYPYEEAFNSPEKMLYDEFTAGISSIFNSVKLKDYLPYHIRSNHGIGIISSLFGAKCKIIYNNMPWVENLKNIEEIKQVVSKGIPEFNSPLCQKVIRDYEYFNQKLKQYPKCSKAIKITQPDLQGPFDNAHLIAGTNIFLYLYDYPDIIHQLLDLITAAYIKFRKYIDGHLTDKAGEDSMYVHGSIYKGSVIIKDDTALISLSEDMYREFVRPYNERILKAFGKGSLHYCGPGKEWHIKNIKEQKFSSVNYGNPEMHTIDEIYNNFKQDKISVIGWGESQYYDDVIKDFFNKDIHTGVSLCVKADNYSDACRILNKHIG